MVVRPACDANLGIGETKERRTDLLSVAKAPVTSMFKWSLPNPWDLQAARRLLNNVRQLADGRLRLAALGKKAR
jgi:hypothetical protein